MNELSHTGAKKRASTARTTATDGNAFYFLNMWSLSKELFWPHDGSIWRALICIMGNVFWQKVTMHKIQRKIYMSLLQQNWFIFELSIFSLTALLKEHLISNLRVGSTLMAVHHINVDIWVKTKIQSSGIIVFYWNMSVLSPIEAW